MIKGLLTKFRDLIKNNWLITLILLVAIILNVLIFNELGYAYTLNSDDVGYIHSGITFFETGQIIMHGVLSAQIMPGMTFIIALFCLVFGTGSTLIFALKIFWILMGLLTIIFVYKTIRLYTNHIFAAIPCIFFLSVDYIWMNNIILTETPFILIFVLLVYYSLKFSLDKKNFSYIMIIILYIIGIFIRPNIALFPIFLILFLLFKGFKIKDLLKKCLIAGIVLLCVLTPWIYRNYKLFDKFIPLTYGTGNPMLLGTYQGEGYPSDDELNYDLLDNQMSKEMKLYLEGEPQEKLYLKKYYLLEYDGMKARYRMAEWWENDKISMIKSYLFHKPKELIYSSFYWDEVLGISSTVLLNFRKIEIIIFGIALLFIMFKRKFVKEWCFLIAVYVSQIALYAYTFAFSRYAISLFFLRYIILGIGLSVIYETIKEILKNKKLIIKNKSFKAVKKV